MKDIYKCRVCNRYVEKPFHCGVRAEPVLDGKRRVMLSKLLSYILRHNPSSIGVSLDSEGWASISDVVKGIKNVWRNKELYSWLTREHIYAIVELDPKGRFEIRNGKVRARYGHDIELKVNVKYDVDVESKILYHGTVKENLNSILKQGVKPMRRRYVHLTTNFNDACETARRKKGEAIVLIIDCSCLRRKGYKIYIASKTVRLVEHVPAECILNIKKCL